MSKCKQCGFELEADVRYCPNCATKVDTQPASSEPAGGFTSTISGTATMFVPEQRDSSADLEPGAEFSGRYTIERKLGQGAMGVVYLASDKLTGGRRVAIKLINPALINSASARERFLREGLIARDIRHKHVVAVYDVSETEGQLYLVMEFLSGETLRNWLHRVIQGGYDVPFDTAERIIRNILEGLDAAHAAGVIHRDVKPENIMLTGNLEAGDYSLKILDFGIARAIVDSAAKQLTTTSTSTGTLLYMAPEQKTAADTVGPPADLYAVTAIFFELLLGVAPTGRWASLLKEREDLPPAIDAIIDKGLSSRPRSRFQSAQEYLKALDDLQIMPVPSPVPQPPEPKPPLPPPPPVKRRKISKRTILLACAVLIGLGIIGALMNQPPTHVIPPIEPPKPPKEEIIEPPPPPPPPPPVTPANYQGQWFDELTGTGIVRTRLLIEQNGTYVRGVILDANGIQWGTFEGTVTGTIIEYNYYSPLGNGFGRGEMEPGGQHVYVLANGIERHTMHRNHLPHR
jgi:serine/threonine protein kinase